MIPRHPTERGIAALTSMDDTWVWTASGDSSVQRWRSVGAFAGMTENWGWAHMIMRNVLLVLVVGRFQWRWPIRGANFTKKMRGFIRRRRSWKMHCDI